MAQSSKNNAPFEKETTFSTYTEDQGKTYAQDRLQYHPSVYKTVIDQHKATHGEFITLVDVGCGTGSAARALSPQFRNAIGLDPSEGMIATARSIEDTREDALGADRILYEVSSAEELENALSIHPYNGIDLIVAANAAHWFDLPRFWASAVRVLKPYGSVALWTSGYVCAHPSMPNAAAIQQAIDEHEELYLKPFLHPGNLLTRGCYKDLVLPWTSNPPIPGFDKSNFFRKDWGPDEDFYTGAREINMDMFESVCGTASPVTRWREENEAAVGTEDDVVRVLRRKIESLLHDVGIEKGKEMVRVSAKGVVLVVKKES